MKDYDVALWLAYVMPAGAPDAIIGKLNRAMAQILRDPNVIENLRQAGLRSGAWST